MSLCSVKNKVQHFKMQWLVTNILTPKGRYRILSKGQCKVRPKANRAIIKSRSLVSGTGSSTWWCDDIRPRHLDLPCHSCVGLTAATCIVVWIVFSCFLW